MKEQTTHLLFTDGSSLGNPGPGGWGAVLVLHSKGEARRVIEMGGYVKHTTNNRMELLALIEGLRRIEKESGDLTIFTDSKYVHKGATEWAAGWQRRGWKTMAKTDVENRDLWEAVLPLLAARQHLGRIMWTHVPGHSGIAGNERCDRVATGFAKQDAVELFEGDLENYDIDILNFAIDQKKRDAHVRSKSKSGAKAYSYVSLVGGVAMRHTTWADCEKRVKGKSGVKYKKALSALDEKQILKSWGAEI